MAPLPPSPKITEVNCDIDTPFVPFVDGWKNDRCYAEVSVADFYVTVTIKGNNLTEDWLRQVIKGAYYNGGSENEATVAVTFYEEGVEANVDFNFNFPFVEGETVQFDINGVKSAWMPMYKGN